MNESEVEAARAYAGDIAARLDKAGHFAACAIMVQGDDALVCSRGQFIEKLESWIPDLADDANRAAMRVRLDRYRAFPANVMPIVCVHGATLIFYTIMSKEMS